MHQQDNDAGAQPQAYEHLHAKLNIRTRKNHPQ